MSEVKAEGTIIIKFVEVKLYLCNECENVFFQEDAKIGLAGNEVSFDVCNECNSHDITLHGFSLRLCKRREK